ncbi:MAG: hypothetical protein KatS3mg131_3862 [Candidatus Tectimicrobiota bacterium]|nr:MAG: hypothetical protein KatS3mg131_3862 [Candidatus Tectomicrobia bacterium]
MTRPDAVHLRQMDDYILDGKYHEATELFCQLATAGHPVPDLVVHVMETAAPYLHVPAHQKLLPNGEFRNVNYDHTILGIRAGMRLMPYLSDKEKYLTLVQAVYYVPQGLDIWSQLDCGFPGHYSREQERCPEDQIRKELHCYFEDQEPLVEGSVEERFQRLLYALTHGDRVTGYRLFLGLAQLPEVRRRLEDTLLFAAIIDQQEFNSFRRVRHIGHKAIRIRSMFDIAHWLGWERAHSFFYVGVPDLATLPIFHSLYDHASVVLGMTFKGEQYTLHTRNTALLDPQRQERFIGRILEGDPLAVSEEITALLQQGYALRSIADTVMLAHARHCVEKLRAPIAYTVPTHSFDYCNVINHWLRAFRNPHQAKAVYLGAWFVTDTIREVDWYPDVPEVEKPDPAPFRRWADGLARRQVLAALEEAIAAQDASRAMALVQSYVERTAERDELIRLLVHCAGKFQGDAHIFRNARSMIEEYTASTCSEAQKNVFFVAWAKFLAFYKKRTLSTACYDLYHRYFV